MRLREETASGALGHRSPTDLGWGTPEHCPLSREAWWEWGIPGALLTLALPPRVSPSPSADVALLEDIWLRAPVLLGGTPGLGRRPAWTGALQASAGEWPGPVLSWPGLHVISGKWLMLSGPQGGGLKGLPSWAAGVPQPWAQRPVLIGLRTCSAQTPGSSNPFHTRPLPPSSGLSGPPLPATSLPGLACGLRLCNHGNRDTLSSLCPPHLHPSLQLPLLRPPAIISHPLSSSLA